MATSGIEKNSLYETNRELSEDEKEALREDLKKTENEINTLRQLLTARQKHVASLKRQLGISPLNEITSDLSHGLKTVIETPVFQKTSEVVVGTAETLGNKWQDMRNSSIFKSFESKIGSAYNNAKMAASTSIDHLAGAARSSTNNSQAQTSHNDNPIPPLS